jgi:pimeloyl-ACP methyl ester carboxylesterase
MQSRTRNVNDIRMTWIEQGEGFPVVLVHGIPTSPALWRHVMPRLPGARCIAWEMVGYGASRVQGRGRDISVAKQAEYLAAFLDATGITRAVFAGHDLGGGVVQILAVRRPELCAGLMLTNAIGYDSWPIPSVKALQMGSGLVRRLPPSALKPILMTLMLRGHDTWTQAKEAMRTHWPHYASRFGPDAFARQVESLDVQDTIAVSDRLQQLAVPARIVWGTADQFQKIEYGERFARDLAAPLYRIEGGKHFTPEDHPDVVANAIRELLEEASSTPVQQTETPTHKGEH